MSTDRQALGEAQVLGAVEARRSDILSHAATVTTKQLLAWLAEDLGLSDEEAVAALRSHRHAAKRCALEVLEEQGQVPGPSAPANAVDLPVELLPAVFRWLDHDSLFCALQVSRAWRAAGTEPLAGDLWEQLCAARGWALPEAAQQQQQEQQQQQVQHQQQHEEQQGAHPTEPPAAPAEPEARLQQAQQPPQQAARDAAPAGAADAAAAEQGHQTAGAASPNWRQVYRQHYYVVCYDCFQPTTRHTLTAGSLRLRLCRACSLGYDSPRSGHRLLSGSTAKRQCCLKDTELAGLPRCVEPNPVCPSFDPMHLFRRLDVRRAALTRWGSWDAVQAEHRKRITRS